MNTPARQSGNRHRVDSGTTAPPQAAQPQRSRSTAGVLARRWRDRKGGGSHLAARAPARPEEEAHFQLLRGRPRGVSSQAPELRERKIGITPFDCPRDNSASSTVALPEIAAYEISKFDAFSSLCNDIIYRACRSWWHSPGAAPGAHVAAGSRGHSGPAGASTGRWEGACPRPDTPPDVTELSGHGEDRSANRYSRSSCVTATPPHPLTWLSGRRMGRHSASAGDVPRCRYILGTGHTRGLRLLARELGTDLLDHRLDHRQLGAFLLQDGLERCPVPPLIKV